MSMTYIYHGILDQNLAKKEKVETAKNELNQINEKLEKEVADFKQLSGRQEKALSKYSVDNLAEMLVVAADEADTLSEDCRRSFVDGEIDHNAFIKKYVEGRTLYHKRKVIRERLVALYGNL
jgi:ESCRT-I complex subunit VPS37